MGLGSLLRSVAINMPLLPELCAPGVLNWSKFLSSIAVNLSFEFGACFGFRVSDFGFVRAGQRCPAEKMWDMLSPSKGEKAGVRGENDLLATYFSAAVAISTSAASFSGPFMKSSARK